jgi:P27 family predicted phage terminase small subunit
MGRPRKPTSLKILEGAQPCRINRSEPKSPEGLGEPPDWLDDHGRDAWRRLKERLAPMRVATRADEEIVMVYCQAYSTLRLALDEVEAHGMLVEQTTEITTKNGSTSNTILKANPMLPAIQQARRQMVQCLTQLGMSPSSRSGLHVQEDRPEDPLAAFMARKSKAGPNGKRRPS